MIMSGIAWAAKKPLDALMTVQGTGGGQGVGGSDIVVPPRQERAAAAEASPTPRDAGRAGHDGTASAAADS